MAKNFTVLFIIFMSMYVLVGCKSDVFDEQEKNADETAEVAERIEEDTDTPSIDLNGLVGYWIGFDRAGAVAGEESRDLRFGYNLEVQDVQGNHIQATIQRYAVNDELAYEATPIELIWDSSEQVLKPVEETDTELQSIEISVDGLIWSMVAIIDIENYPIGAIELYSINDEALRAEQIENGIYEMKVLSNMISPIISTPTENNTVPEYILGSWKAVLAVPNSNNYEGIRITFHEIEGDMVKAKVVVATGSSRNLDFTNGSSLSMTMDYHAVENLLTYEDLNGYTFNVYFDDENSATFTSNAMSSFKLSKE